MRNGVVCFITIPIFRFHLCHTVLIVKNVIILSVTRSLNDLILSSPYKPGVLILSKHDSEASSFH